MDGDVFLCETVLHLLLSLPVFKPSIIKEGFFFLVPSCSIQRKFDCRITLLACCQSVANNILCILIRYSYCCFRD